MSGECRRKLRLELARRRVRIFGKENGCALLRVGNIDSGIGADKTVDGFSDDDAALHFDDALGFAEHELDDTRIFCPFPRPVACVFRWFDGIQTNDSAFRLGDNLLRDDENIAVGDLDVAVVHEIHHEMREIIALTDLGQPGNRKDLDLCHQRFLWRSFKLAANLSP